MKLVTVSLESLAAGAEIVSDVHDALGRLLLKAPRVLDDHTKKTLLSRGVREVIIQDRRKTARVEDARAIERELAALDHRMSLLDNFPSGKGFRDLVRKTVEEYYEGSRPEEIF